MSVSNKNQDKNYNVSVTLRVDSVLYTGKPKSLVKKEKFDHVIAPVSCNLNFDLFGDVAQFIIGFSVYSAAEEMVMYVTFKEYAPHLADQCAFNIACLANVVETDFEYFAQDDFRVRKPDIRIQAPGQVNLGEEFSVDVSLKNPLPVALNRGKFTIEGAGLGEPKKVVLPT